MNCVWNLLVSAVALKCKYTHLDLSRMLCLELKRAEKEQTEE